MGTTTFLSFSAVWEFQFKRGGGGKALQIYKKIVLIFRSFFFFNKHYWTTSKITEMVYTICQTNRLKVIKSTCELLQAPVTFSNSFCTIVTPTVFNLSQRLILDTSKELLDYQQLAHAIRCQVKKIQ